VNERKTTGLAIAVFLVVMVAAAGATGLVIAQKRDEKQAPRPRSALAPARIDRIERGTTEPELRQMLGEPAQIRVNFASSQRCLFYDRLAANQPAYRFCFDRGKLVAISPQ
jgi:hypothetical protein